MCSWHCFSSCGGWSLLWGWGFWSIPLDFPEVLVTSALTTVTMAHGYRSVTVGQDLTSAFSWSWTRGRRWVVPVDRGNWDSLKAPGVLCGRQFTFTADCSASHAGELLVLGFPTSSCLDRWIYLCCQRGSNKAMSTVWGNSMIEGKGCEE